jgi:hypothetical protein
MGGVSGAGGVCAGYPENGVSAGPGGARPSGSRGEGTAAPAKPKEDGIDLPSFTIGGFEIPLPRPVMSTTSVYDGGVTGERRRADLEGLDRARRGDDRDMDPKALARDKRERVEKWAPVVDRAVRDGFDAAARERSDGKTKTVCQEQMDEFYRQQRQRFGGPGSDQK